VSLPEGVDIVMPPEWPGNVRVVRTSRPGGVSPAPFDSFNLGEHVGDAPEAVAENRRRLQTALPGIKPFWLGQVHGTQVVEALARPFAAPPEADACWTRQAGIACAVMTADCLPVLFTDRDGVVVAAAHAGWRGLAAGVIEETVRALPVDSGSLIAWLGPCIGPDAFEVGTEVRETFLEAVPGEDRTATAHCFRAVSRAGAFMADLQSLARIRLARLGVTVAAADPRCTFANPEELYSYRRDGKTGRMAFLVFRRSA